MGNICAVDMGLIILRVSVFDKSNSLFPYKIQQKLQQRRGLEGTEFKVNTHEPYFMSDLSFYSKQYGGTFHFLQFNVLYRDQFLESLEFKYLMRFIEKEIPKLKYTNEQWGEYIQKLEFHKTYLDFDKSSIFSQKHSQNILQMPILSTGGYNDKFLAFISNCFNTKIVKCREYMKFLMKALDHLNQFTNDCFFTYDRKNKNTINHSGWLDLEGKPIQQYFSLKEQLYPYLLVNMRSGATLTVVKSATESKRITGSPIGVNIYVGILRALNAFNDPIDAIDGAIHGNNQNCDLSVGDIYGDSSKTSLNLPNNMIASSFGLIQQTKNAKEVINKNDISRSLLTMVIVNTLMLSDMVARTEKITNVVWVGGTVVIDEYMQMAQDTLKTLSGGKCRLIFPTYGSFLGSLGLLLSKGVIEENEISDSEEEDKVEDLKFQELKLHKRKSSLLNISKVNDFADDENSELQMFGKKYKSSFKINRNPPENDE